MNDETNENYDYFFRHQSNAVGHSREIVFISDHNHGILKAVSSIFPESVLIWNIGAEEWVRRLGLWC